MRHHEMDGGPYIVLSTITKDRKSGIYKLSVPRMEVKSKTSTALYASPRHLWKIFKDYEENKHGNAGRHPCLAIIRLSHGRLL
jgi:UbiD family decarboxylase